MKRISHLITTNEVLRWPPGSSITISAGTGAGKSYFVKNILYEICKQNNKKILMLIHRVNCVDQFRKEIIRDKKTDVIDIRTYQSIENQRFFDFSEYDYIVSDEFHYFLSDAAFNKSTDISLNKILSQDNSIKIFMSATGDYMKKYINKKLNIDTIPYALDIEYKFIKRLLFYNTDETLERFIEKAISKNDKGIFFIQSAEKAYKLYLKFQDHCLFNCGKSDKHYKYVDTKKISDMLVNEKFNENILITTAAMDAGVNINDIGVKHIVLDIKDISVLIQCLGRRRIQYENDYINVYIKAINNKELNSMEKKLKRKIEKAEFLSKHSVQEYILEYPRDNDYSNIVYDDIVNETDKGTKKINKLMYYKCKFDLSDIAEMKFCDDQYGYCKYLVNKFKYNIKYIIIEEKYKYDNINEYLDNKVGKKLYKDEQKELIDIIGLKDAKGRIQKSIGQLNAYLKPNKLNYLIESERKSIRVNGKIKKDSYWMIYKLSKNVDENVEKSFKENSIKVSTF